MNLQLLNPFAHENFPERVDTSLDANAQCVRFNGGTSRFAGSLVAIGRTDGCVSVLDFKTRGYLRFLEGHVKGVTALSWSRNSRYLLSASRDWNVIIWDLHTGERRDTIRFDAPITSAVLHPRNSKIVLVTLQNQAEAVLVDLRHEQGGRWELDSSLLEDEENEASMEDARAARRRRETVNVARFNGKGDLIYLGTSAGMLHVFDTQTKMLVHSEKLSAGSSIKHLEFDRTGQSLVVASNDRVIRVFAVNEAAFYAQAVGEESHLQDLLIPQHRFQDLVNRTPWNAIRFSNDGEYVVAGAGHKAAHQIYLWDCATGNLSKILEGPKDPLADVDWHPVKPVCVSTSSDQGLFHIWVTNVIERWSAYAAGFEELEENLEYQEREDEFDVEDEDKAQLRDRNKQEVPIDVLDLDATASIAKTTAMDEYMASSAEWASEEPDEDDKEDFFPPLDADLSTFELEEGDARGAEAINGRATRH